jgi:aminoglycoside phosphotransferase (APT) family kinase protein
MTQHPDLDPSRDTAALIHWLSTNIKGIRGPCTLTRLSGGQSNPTWRIDTADQALVLRAKPLGTTLASAHAIDREYRVLKALGTSDVPVPEVLALCQDDTVFGSAFYVMRYLDGRILMDPRLPASGKADRTRIFDSTNAVIAARLLIFEATRPFPKHENTQNPKRPAGAFPLYL